TAAYMSPEQAKGRSADKRSDIWAFGCVVHEMLSGRRVLANDNVTPTLAAVMTQAPDSEALPSATPWRLRRLLRRFLEKEARRRLQAIGEARVEIEDLLSGAEEDVHTQPAPRIGAAWRRSAAAVAAGVAVGLAIAGLVWVGERSPATRP